MLKSYSQQSLNLRSHSQSVLTNPKQSFIGTDKYQNWKFFQPGAVTLNSKTLLQSNINVPVLSPIRSQQQLHPPITTMPGVKRSRKGASFIDQILEAATTTQALETKDFFMTQVHSESILPPIIMNDKHEYKSLLHRQHHVPYLVSKHVRLASERLKYGKVENNHYQHYEKLDMIETVLQKVKPSEKTLNYQPRAVSLQKPSLELQKQLNRKMQEEGQEPIMREVVQETYQSFGMTQDDIDDVQAMIQEEGDRVDFEAKEIKFTEHQTEFRTICSKVNKDKSAEVFLKQNRDYSQWNLKDRNSILYFLSRAAAKEPHGVIEKELEDKHTMQEDQQVMMYRKPTMVTKVENRHEEVDESLVTEEGMASARTLKDYGEYLEVEVKAQQQALSERNSRRKQTESPRHPLSESDDQQEAQAKAQEEEELKKFILLAKLKYENSIKGYDRLPGLKSNLDDFTEALMEKLFQKREPTDEFKYMLKKDTTHSRVDLSKPQYMDDLKRYQKLKEVGGRKVLTIERKEVEELRRDIQEINIFNEEFVQKSPVMKVKKVKIVKKEETNKDFKGAWYLPIQKWGEQGEKLMQQQMHPEQVAKKPKIGVLTKQALNFLMKPYHESNKKLKLFNKDDEITIKSTYSQLKEVLKCPLLVKYTASHTDVDDDEDLDYQTCQEEFAVIKHFLLPGQPRLTLFEWLLEQYEPGLLNADDLKGLQELTTSERLLIVFKQIGLTTYQHGKKSNPTEHLLKSIEGLNGTSDSLQLLSRLITFVLNAKQVELLGDRQLHNMSDKLMNHICINNSAMFQSNVRLFPPGFTKSDFELDYDVLDDMIEDLSTKVNKIEERRSDLNAEAYFSNQDQVKLATDSEIQSFPLNWHSLGLKSTLQELQKVIMKFNIEFEDSISKGLRTVGQSNQVRTKIGPLVEQTHLNKTAFDQMTGKFKQIMESLGQLGVKLQMAGLDKDKNFKSGQGDITSEKVLELVSQIKTIKLSLGCQAKFGKLY